VVSLEVLPAVSGKKESEKQQIKITVFNEGKDISDEDKVKILYGPTFDTVIIYGFPLIRKVSGVRELMNGTNVNVVNSKSGIHIKMMAANISIVSRTRTVTIIQIDNNMFYSKYNGSVPKVPQRL